MKIIIRLLNYLQYILIRAAGIPFDLVPPARAYDIGYGVMKLFYPLFRKRRRIAIDNILKAGITTSLQQADHIARNSFGHLGGHICESFKTGQILNRENWHSHVEIEMNKECRELIFERLDQPLIILTGHLGSWEASAPILSLIRPMMAVARRMNNPFVERFMRKHHFRGTITVIDKNKGFTPSVLKQWKQNAAIMAIVMDQHAGSRTGLKVDFMGRPAGTHTSPARLHLSTGAPVLIGAVIRTAPFKYKLISGEPIRYKPSQNRDEDLKSLLELFNSRLEELIRSYPERYLWMHNRWRDANSSKKRKSKRKNGG